jgi:ferric-dicitrate binding protein FerR (iron transport regulator)
MTPTDRPGARRRSAALIAVSAAAAMMLGAATFYAVQKLSRDDCTTMTSSMPDGSEITIRTCS